ncbi:MAG: SDR family NAD(P)-dependent oxidoreductase, partial [Candidatus Desantisbacteria bacterium]
MNRVVIVTGASRGLGARIAQCFSDARFAVVVNYNENKDKAEGLVHGLRGNGHDAVAIHADVSKPAEVMSMIDMVMELWGRIDVLVNNAGVAKDS